MPHMPKLSSLRGVSFNETTFDSQHEIPDIVLGNICLHLQQDHAQGTLLSILLASRTSYVTVAPHLYLDLHISKEGIDSIICGLQLGDKWGDLRHAKSALGSDGNPLALSTKGSNVDETGYHSDDNVHPEASGEFLEHYDDATRALLRHKRRERYLKAYGVSRVRFFLFVLLPPSLELTTDQTLFIPP